MDLSTTEIEQITQFLDVTTPLPDEADLLFIFATRLLTPANMATDLWFQQRAPYLVVTGGANRTTGENEASQHYQMLIDAGVPTDRIIVENRSTNTYENVVFALPLIAQKLPLASIRSVLAVCKWMHSRRAVMTLKRHFPPRTRFYVATYEPAGITRSNWPDNPRRSTANVLKEWESIPRYLELGHIQEICYDGTSWI
jgi:uncharacterized SAM-binding protein YcdF (DUF218 family)